MTDWAGGGGRTEGGWERKEERKGERITVKALKTGLLSDLIFTER